MSRTPQMIRDNPFYGWGYNDGLVVGICIGAGIALIGGGLGILVYVFVNH